MRPLLAGLGEARLPRGKIQILHGRISGRLTIEASIFVVRAFIRLREIISLKQELSEKIKELELKTFEGLEDHGEKLQFLFDAIDQLLVQKSAPREPIGYKITSHKP